MKKRTVRPDSVVAFHNCQGLKAQGTLLRLSRNAVVFEVYNPYSVVQLSEVLTDLQIRRGERAIYEGKAVVTNLVSTGLMLIVSASLVDPWSDIRGLSPGPDLRSEVENFVGQWTETNETLEPGYKDTVTNARNFLQELSRWLEHSETLAGVRDPDAPPEMVEEFVSDVKFAVMPRLDELFGRFEEQCGQLTRKAVATHKAFAQRELHPLVLCAPYIHRTFSKPLGYAGDYEMVNMILRNQHEGTNTFAKVINAYPLQVGTAQAHRNRIAMLVQHLVDETQRVHSKQRRLRVLNVGCGPASEVEGFVARHWLSDYADFELVDFNQETLAYTQQRLDNVVRKHRRNTNIQYIHRSIHTLLEEVGEREGPVEAEFDLVYCAGLFDYLGDSVCTRLVQLFFEQILPDGLVIVTNVHSGHPSKGFMEHLLEWSLYLRDEVDMRVLAPDLGVQEVRPDASGHNVFLEIRKPANDLALS